MNKGLLMHRYGSCDSTQNNKMATYQETGYQCEFVDNVKDYECPLCLHVTREPNLTSCCGQHFCHNCIQTALSDKKLSSFCKENDFMAFLDKKQKRKVLNLKIYCKHKGSCNWVGSLGELDHHLSEKCQYVSVNCSNNCGKSMIRIHLKVHKTTCPKRPHSCEYCQLKQTYRDIQENHIPVCLKYPVICPNECEVSSLLRDQLEEHLTECPLAMVDCELREVGCKEKLQRKDLDRHMEEAIRKHLTLSTSYIKKQDKEELRQENDKLRRNLAKVVCETNFPQKVILCVNYNQLGEHCH